MNLSKWQRTIIIFWCISILIVIYYSLVPQVEFPVDFWNADKLYHCAAYGWLAVLPMLGFANPRRAASAAFSMILLGILLEVGQYYIPGRSFSLLDITANTLGVAMGFFLGGYLKSRLTRKEICFPG
ncbi:MAG: VanZ family protein [Smithella sp.]